ncbi:MAG: TonB-dependent receptor [Steroidobacteraceae bacterium]
MNRAILGWALGSAVVVLAGPQPSSAQESTTTQLEEVIVTAQRRAQSLEDVPISVAVMGGDYIDRYAINSLGEVSSKMPNVNIAQNPGADFVNIRGVGSGNNLGFEQSVATFVDGNYRSRSRASRFAFFDVERIEILRGPQTTFFGNNAIAGALNITTRRPDSSKGINVSGLYSPSDGEYSANVGATFPLTDTLSIRAAAQLSGMDGYIDNNLLDEDGPDLDSKMGRISAVWKPNEILEFFGRVDVGKSRDKGVYDSDLVDCPPSSPPFALAGACARHLAAGGEAGFDYETVTGPSHFDMDLVDTVLHTTINLQNHSIKLLTGYSDIEWENNNNVMPTLNASQVGTVSGLPTRSHEDMRFFSQEIRLESTSKGRFDYMLGAYYSDTDLDDVAQTGFYFNDWIRILSPVAPVFTTLQPGDPIGNYTTNSQDDETLSGFGALTVHITDLTRMNLGLRYSKVKKEVSRNHQIGRSLSNERESDFTPATPAEQAVLNRTFGYTAGDFPDPKRSDDKWLPSISFEHDLTEDVMGYVSYSKGFKAGGYTIGTSADSFDPETVDAYEMGVKSTFFDRRVRFNIAAFYSEYTDLQETTFSVGASGIPVSITGNAAESTSKGVELESAFQVSEELQLTLDVALLSSEYDKHPRGVCPLFLQATTPQCVADLSGKDRAYSPDYSGNFGIAYTRPITDTLELRVNSDLFFTAEYFTQANADPLSQQDSFAKWDLRLAVGSADRRWELAVIGKNLTDEETFQFWSPLPSSLGAGQVNPERPRSVALQFTMNFLNQ